MPPATSSRAAASTDSSSGNERPASSANSRAFGLMTSGPAGSASASAAPLVSNATPTPRAFNRRTAFA